MAPPHPTCPPARSRSASGAVRAQHRPAEQAGPDNCTVPAATTPTSGNEAESAARVSPHNCMTPARVPPSTTAARCRSSPGTMPETNIGRSPSMSASSSPPAPPTTTTVGRGGCRPKRPTAEERSSTSVTSTATAAAPSAKSICRAVVVTGRPGKIGLCNGARHPAKQRGHPVVGARLVAAHAGGPDGADRTLTWRSLLPAYAAGGHWFDLAMLWNTNDAGPAAQRCRRWLVGCCQRPFVSQVC